MRPIITRSEITGSVYITTKYRALGSGELDTYEKYDVTHEFDAIAGCIVAENERLRELVREMWDVLECDVDCVIVCEHFGECDWGRACVFKTRMRELGFEV